MEQYIWDEGESILSALLIGYGDESDNNCAKAIWLLLENEGATKYSNEVERNRVLLLLLSVIEFVNDCTSLIREDSYELDATFWASEAEINSFRIAQLVGEDFEDSDNYDSEELYELALLELLSESRNKIIACIRKTHGSVGEILKFIGEFYEQPSQEDMISDDDFSLFYEQAVMPENVLDFVAWIDEGMPRRN